MSKNKKRKKNKKDRNNINDNLMELLDNIDLEQVMSLLSGQSSNDMDDDYDRGDSQMDLSSLVQNFAGMNPSNKNHFNDPTIQLINILRPIIENNRGSMEKLLQVYFLTRLINNK